MRVPSPMRIAMLSLLVAGLACAKNRANEDVGAARDTTGLDTMADNQHHLLDQWISYGTL